MRTQSFDSKWDASSLRELERLLEHVPAESVKAVRKSNRLWAGKLRDLIRGSTNLPRLSAKSKKKQGARHDTKRSLRWAITSRAGTESSAVVARRSKFPHFNVIEFGGGVMWRRGSEKHRIGVRKRSPSMKTMGLYDKKGRQRGATGWFFWPTIRDHLDDIQASAVKGAEDAVRRTLPRRID